MEALHGRLRLIFDAPDLETAWRLKEEVVRQYTDDAPEAAARFVEGFDDAMAVIPVPERYRKRLRATNVAERLNEEIRRREQTIRIFLNAQIPHPATAFHRRFA